MVAGREREQATLRGALDAALAGRGGLVLIGGEAGIGKTTLAESLCANAAGRGALVLVGRCYDLAETPPYGPWAEALSHAPSGDGLPALPSALLPPEREDGEALVGPDAIFRRVLVFLAALAARQPLVLLLDDLHWADPASLDLLRHVGRGLGEVPLLLLATYRSDEIARRHPLYQLLPLLVREARANRLDLRPLDRDALLALIRTRYALSVEAETRLVDYLAGRAEGNPLFAGELLRALEEADTLRSVGAAWALGDLAAVGVPPLLRQVIDARVDRLGEETRALLALAAVIGQDVSLDLWAAIAEVSEDELALAIERAVEARLLDLREDGNAARFAHALIREALYEGMLPLRRRAWHRRIGEALAATDILDPDTVAQHFRRAGDVRAAEWLDRAAERARRAYAWGMAAERLEAALALGEQRDADPGERGWRALRLGLLRRHADQRQAIDLFEQAVLRAAEVTDLHLAAYARFGIGLVHCYVGDYRRGVDEMETAVATLDPLPPLDETARARLRSWGLADEPDHHRGTLALWFALTGRVADAIALGERVATRLGDSHGGIWLDGAFAPDTLRGLGVAYAHLGRATEAQTAFERHLAYCRAVGDFGQAAMTVTMTLRTVVLPYRADDIAGRRRVAEEGTALATQALDSWTTAPPRLWASPLLLLEGHWDELRALVAGAIVHSPHVFGQRMLGLIPLAYFQGNHDEAQAALRLTLPDGAASEQDTIRALAAYPLLLIAAALAQDGGDLTVARSWLATSDRAPDLLHQVHGRLAGAPGRQQIIDDQHPLPSLDRIAVHLDRVCAIFERILRADRLGRQPS